MTAREKPFATEADLCRRFLAGVAKVGGWTSYAETQGWDILLVRDEDGFQIGIEAKLKFNLHVINQALESGQYSVMSPGPDCRAVMVPDSEYGFEKIAAYVGFTVIRVRPESKFGYGGYIFDPALPKSKDSGFSDHWHEWCPAKRHELPEYVPDVAAGSSAPLQLTDWKISAIKIAITLERRGYVTRADFKHHGIDHRRWLSPTGWLRFIDGRYVAGGMPDFKGQHPKAYEQIAADADKWMPTTLPMTQGTML